MPIYTFHCLKCDYTFDIRKRISDNSLPVCKKCSGETEKIIAPCSFTLVGGGWASDGYSSSSEK